MNKREVEPNPDKGEYVKQTHIVCDTEGNRLVVQEKQERTSK